MDKKEKLFKYLRTTTLRDGIEKVTLCILPTIENKYVLIRSNDRYELIKEETSIEDLDKKIRDLLIKTLGTKITFKIGHYLGTFISKTENFEKRYIVFVTELNEFRKKGNIELLEDIKQENIEEITYKTIERYIKKLNFKF